MHHETELGVYHLKDKTNQKKKKSEGLETRRLSATSHVGDMRPSANKSSLLFFHFSGCKQTYSVDVKYISQGDELWSCSGRWEAEDGGHHCMHQDTDRQKLCGHWEDEEPFTDSCRLKTQDQTWGWKLMDASAYAGVLLPFHCTIVFLPVAWSMCFCSVFLFPGTFLICHLSHFLCPTWRSFPLFHHLLSFFLQLCSLSVPALIYPVGWPLCKILWEQDVPLILN